jgi:diguanylate cyclase (GGDEF)-like protein/PAS domain S-box-containing protein
VSAGFYTEAFGFALSSLSSFLVLGCLVWLGAEALNREEERYRRSIDSSPVATIMIDKMGIIRTANRLAHSLFRYQASQMLGQSLESLIPDRFRMNYAGYQYDYKLQPEPRMIGEGRELFALRRDGTEFRAEIVLSPVQNADSYYFMAVIVDITERVEAQQQILRLNRMHKVLSSINSLIIRLPSRETLCSETSRIAVEEGNLSAAVFVEHDIKTGQLKMFSAYAGGRIIEAKQLSGTETDAIRECLRTHRTVLRDDKANPLSNGKPLSLISTGVQALAAFPLTSPEHSLETAMVLYQGEPFLFDQPDMKLLHELAGDVAFAIANLDRRQQFEYMMYFDSVTQLPNRLLLADRLQQALLQADNNQGVVSIVYMDIDRFKQVNDSLGHTHGDTVLRTVAQRINACVGKADTVSRWGGDEFVILLPGQNAAEASLVATCIIGALLSVIELVDGQELFVACSMGIAEYPRNGRDMDTLINSAATAMSHIKEQGGNDCQPSKVDTNDILNDGLALETSLRHALRLEQFQLYFQPQINITSHQIVGMEALVRWQHPTQGVISPDRFIPIAEKTGLIIPLGEWVLREACRLGATMPTLTVAVNLSARQFHQENLVDVIRQILNETAMPAHNLELEITESALMYDVESAIAKMEQLIALGARISLDDFGTGYSSLSYLKRFPIHTLKIDKSFITQLTTDAGSEVIVNTVIAMAHGLGLNVIAEGVETEAQLAMLRARGCDQAQGYLFARPMPYQEVVDKVRLIT